MLGALYQIPTAIPQALWTPLASAEDALARLDERLAKSPIREGWAARMDFADTCASLRLSGALVLTEDLMLHDAHMNARAPTHELVQAQAVLASRRRIAAAKPDWALSPAGVAVLCGRAGKGDQVDAALPHPGDPDDRALELAGVSGPSDAREAALAEAYAAVDAAITRAQRALTESAPRRSARDPLIYDPDHDEAARLAEWRRLVEQTASLPPTLAAALVGDAWETLAPMPNEGLGRLLAAALLRARGKSRAHLAGVSVGLRAVPRERRRSPDPSTHRPIDAAGRLARGARGGRECGTEGPRPLVFGARAPAPEVRRPSIDLEAAAPRRSRHAPADRLRRDGRRRARRYAPRRA